MKRRRQFAVYTYKVCLFNGRKVDVFTSKPKIRGAIRMTNTQIERSNAAYLWLISYLNGDNHD